MAPPSNLTALLDRERFENMDPAEWAVIRDWLRLHGASFDAIDCNARIGEGRHAPAGADEPAQRMWKACTQLRADVVATRGNELVIVEAKEHARIGAVTQVMRYVGLVLLERRGAGRVSALIVCRSCDQNVAPAIAFHGGAVEIVTAAAAALSV